MAMADNQFVCGLAFLTFKQKIQLHIWNETNRTETERQNKSIVLISISNKSSTYETIEFWLKLKTIIAQVLARTYGAVSK